MNDNRKEQEAFVREMAIEEAVERLCHNLTAIYHKNPDVYIQVELATDDKKARTYGWPDAEAMREGIKTALSNLPKDIADGVIIKKV